MLGEVNIQQTGRGMTRAAWDPQVDGKRRIDRCGRDMYVCTVLNPNGNYCEKGMYSINME